MQSDTSNTHLKTLQNYIAKPEANQEQGLDVWYFNAMDDKSAHAEMLALNLVNSRARNTFKHLLISFSPDVFPTRHQAHEASQMLLQEMGLDKCVAMTGMHYDKDHVHLHVAVVTNNPETYRSVHAEWALEAMHRAAAKINYLQGCKPQDNQRYSMINVGDQIIAYKNTGKTRTLKVNEVIAFQGQRPAADVAAEVVKLVLADPEVNSWDMFNRRLADNGIEYQKKGSGSIFMVEQGDKPIAVKASVVNRNATTKLLEIKFGPFIANTHPIKQRSTEPVKGMSDSVKLSWQNFNEHKALFAIEKATLKDTQSKQYKQLLDAQKVERNNLYLQSWKGKGVELNKQRMILAALQAKQKAKLKQHHVAQQLKLIQNVYKKYGPTSRFDDYLKFTDADLLAQYKQQQRQAKNDSKIYPGATGVERNSTFTKVSGIETYEFHQAPIGNGFGQKFVLKFTNQDGRVDFIDEGKRIKVINVDKESVHAFLQISSQKWRRFELTGSAEFKYMCAEEAVKLKIDKKIVNHEVQVMIAKIRQLDEAKKIGAATEKINLKRWNKPLLVKDRPLKKLSVTQIIEPTNRLEAAINAYLTHAEDLSTKPKNDYFRDFEIAIRLQAVGFTNEEILHAISYASPLVLNREVHSRYTKHLVDLINAPHIKEEWKDVIERKRQDWVALSRNTSNPSSTMRPKF